MSDFDVPGHGGRVLRDARRAERIAARPVRVVCLRCRNRLDMLTGEPEAGPLGAWLAAAIRDPRAVDRGTLRYRCDHCGGDWRVRPERLRAAYAAALADGSRVVMLPLARS